MQPKMRYGAKRNSGEALCASTTSLCEQLGEHAVGLQQRRRAPVLQPGAALVDPAGQQRREQHRQRELGELRGESGGADHRTKSSSSEQRGEAVHAGRSRCGRAAGRSTSPVTQFDAAARPAGRASTRGGPRAVRGSAGAVARRRRVALRMRKNGSKTCRIGWPKPSAVSCMRAFWTESRSPRRAVRRDAAVVEAAHQQPGERDQPRR